MRVNEPRTLPEIVAALDRVATEIVDWFETLPEGEFLRGDDQHWSPAHHLGHLTTSHVRVGRALRSPAALPARDPAPSRTFAEIRALYADGLPRIPREKLLANPVPPRLPADPTRARVLADYAAAAAGTRAATATWADAELETRALPHPFLGPMSVREMLCFMAIHDRHHLDGVRAGFSSR